MIEQIKIPRKQKLKIDLDDFGKASSNLLRLTKLPIDIVKLDKSLITDVHRDQKARLAVRGISSIAKEIGMTVIAEGVETKEQARHLCEQDITSLLQANAENTLVIEVSIQSISAAKAADMSVIQLLPSFETLSDQHHHS